MHTLALPKSVFSFEPGPQRLLAHSELAYLIKKKEGEPTRSYYTPCQRKQTPRANQARQRRLNITDHTFMILMKTAPWEWHCSIHQIKKVQTAHQMMQQCHRPRPCQHSMLY